MAEQAAVVVDLETTGLTARRDRIIEIAAVRVHDGCVVDQWHTLVNPGITIAPLITALTGITAGMAADAPAFDSVSDTFRTFVGDAVLVAHNAAFDLGFLRAELARLDGATVSLPAETLCTLKLARRLFPGLPSHSLEALIQSLGLPVRRHHRALPDALATADLLSHLIRRAAQDGIRAWVELRQRANSPKRRRPLGTYERDRARELPNGPGVYLLKDCDANIFYVGKSVNVRRRVQDHVRGTSKSQPMLHRQLKRLADIEVISTQSELEALILEARLIKRYLPVANQQLRDETHYPFIRIDVQNEYPRIELTRMPGSDPALYFGPFRSARLVGSVVDYLRGALGIRECHRPDLPDGQPCLLFHLHKCLGPCIGAVTPVDYRAAVEKAVGLLRGEWSEIISGLEARMLELAERELFEDAAELRDLLGQLRAVASAQQQIHDLGTFHAVLISRLGPGQAQLFFVHAGRLAEQVTIQWPKDRRAVRALTRRVFQRPHPGPITREGYDEAFILTSWTRQRELSPDHCVVALDPDHLDAGIDRLRAALDAQLQDSPAVDQSISTTPHLVAG
jgi:DNA polymerase-3 subunit epsilon